MPWQVQDVLEQVAFALVEASLVSAFPGPVAVGNQPVALVDPAVYVGAQLVAGYRTANQEVVTVTAITGATFTANFSKIHAQGDAIVGATFPSGQVIQYLVGETSTASPLFTQAEILQYFRDVQNDFLEATRLIYAVGAQNLQQGVSIYNSPADSIRIERIAIAGSSLWNVSQAELDMDNPGWQGVAGAGNPTQWFQDRLNTAEFYLASPPPPANPAAAELWYSQKGTTIPSLTDSLIVPDIFWPYLKYGVLAKVWSKDGETKDPRRAAYCEKRFARGVAYGIGLARAIEVAMNLNK